ncbi:YbfB/YjiJ family MFS transporter [Burkholderia cenocepacia]|uniref:YbfB/YjiJ family MFS transporter n=1 Tax=Burkholderia sola TaxID=2843302 RepID=UPI000F596E96|nr:YbfB/YjiJ family MFS transporter [Burkholderia cenocepacia]RQU80235.1 YbfB/YjiJ family MFS transporter [Burkholderia cenocepacia]RQU91220.1 YbfB/YjiJ family MFS transporter [Burkholderia cenocepacia]RQV70981.1 YbfB/YjiJ family MFS transporter [Burkholderia cenocepacia]RQV89078.1 YbfB/YjiJ family MFS transporter [Burkholderia cenocepacia]
MRAVPQPERDGRSRPDAGATDPGRMAAWRLAICLSLGSAIALGLARFSYALLLPPMKADLGWTFAQAGALNTANAAGYLIGALAFPLLSRRWRAGTLLAAGCALTAVLMAAGGLTPDMHALLAQRLATGVGSALIFISGGVLAARLASASPRDAGLLLGLYYGGTGWGIVASSLLVPATLVSRVHGWQPAWFALATACVLFSAVAVSAARRIEHAHAAPATRADGAKPAAAASPARFALALAGYALFGVGYIGYMTFIVALLRGAGMSGSVVAAFYVMLGVATVVSARLWSGLLDRMRGGQALAVLNALLGVATLMPALFVHPAAAFASGLLFGATFLSAVASTTAFVRHNLPPDGWAKGISAFTTVFAFGQIAGPVAIGWVSDSAGLARGLVYSALTLFAGAAFAAGQRALRSTSA